MKTQKLAEKSEGIKMDMRVTAYWLAKEAVLWEAITSLGSEEKEGDQIKGKIETDQVKPMPHCRQHPPPPSRHTWKQQDHQM